LRFSSVQTILFQTAYRDLFENCCLGSSSASSIASAAFSGSRAFRRRRRSLVPGFFEEVGEFGWMESVDLLWVSLSWMLPVWVYEGFYDGPGEGDGAHTGEI